MSIEEELFEIAKKYRENSFSPYSKFKVGAALLSEDGEIFGGCNVENSSYGLTICAERVAIFNAVSEGKRSFKKILILTDTENLTPPCGACRQVIWDICGDVEVILMNLGRKSKRFKMRELLPYPFDDKFL